MTVPSVLTGRFAIFDVDPSVESGRRPAKAVVAEIIPVSVTAAREGHESLAVEVVVHDPRGREHLRRRMTPVDSEVDRWSAPISCDAQGDWSFTIEAWDDPWSTWCSRAGIKIPANIDVELEFAEGAQLLERAAKALPRGTTTQRKKLRTYAASLRDAKLPPDVRWASAHDADLTDIMTTHPLRGPGTSSGPWPLRVERRTALFGSWYEFFPRSEGSSVDPPRSGTFVTAAARLPHIAAMGFDVIYLPPIHPIGITHRKGPNNSVVAGPDDPGSPWAIGSPEGGHDAIHPELGTLADFTAFVRTADDLGLQIALDLALQASPDHPWVKEHPEWFTTRADGTIAYAENPPKKYQDIYPLNFDNDPDGLYAQIERIVRLWISHGVRIFRVDNPHTKPLWVWDRLFASIHETDPDVIFLAEAFTRPPMMRALAEVGFQQSYTYFTWRNTRHEIEDYLNELAGPASAYMRPNFFVNTPDILSEYLQYGGPAAFAIRATLAATLSPTWGMYSGFEQFEHLAIRPGSEEYLDSEKYQFKPRNWDTDVATLVPYLTRLNTIRREHPALQDLRSLRFHHPDNGEVIAYSKQHGDDLILVVVSLDPHQPQEATVWWDMPTLGMEWQDRFVAHDLLTNHTWTWGQSTYVRLDPGAEIAHIIHVQRPTS